MTDSPLVTELWAIHEAMEDRGMCPYLRRGEEGQDPQGTCAFGCRDEPSCMTDYDPEVPWASLTLRALIARIEQVPDLGLFGSAHDMDGVPWSVHREPGEGYHGTFPLYPDDEPVYRLAPPPVEVDGG